MWKIWVVGMMAMLNVGVAAGESAKKVDAPKEAVVQTWPGEFAELKVLNNFVTVTPGRMPRAFRRLCTPCPP